MHPNQRFLLIIIIGIILWGFSAETAHAQITINSVGINQAPCAYSNISDAIANASDGDTIYISAGTYLEQLGDITKSLTFVPSTPGLCILEDTGANSFSVKIDGTGTTSIAGGIVHIKNKATVTFRHMQLRNGSAENGGIMAISEGSTVILDDVNILSGTSSKDGGGIYLTADPALPSTLRLINGSNLYINWAVANGGGIALFNSILIVDRGNIGLAASEGATFFNRAVNGGGIYAFNSTVMLNDESVVRRNTASSDGAGIYAESSQIIIDGGQVIDNEADNRGGGLFIDGGLPANISDATIQGNSAFREGGGIYTDRSLNLTDGTIQFNSSLTRNGGGIYANGSSRTVTINGTTLADNSGARKGGGVFMTNGGTLNLTNATMSRNMTTQQEVNGLDGGGAIYADDSSSVTATGTIFHNNQSDGGGGAIFVSGITTTLSLTGADSSTIEDMYQNSANSEEGGAIKSVGSDVTLIGMHLADNSAETNGGGLFVGSFDDISFSTRAFIDVTNGRIHDNVATGNGGGMFLSNTSLTLAGSFLSRNVGVNGGGLHINGGFTWTSTFDDVSFTANKALEDGGAFFVETPTDYRTFQFNDVRFRSNRAEHGAGGAIRSLGRVTLKMSDCLFDSNRVAGTTEGPFQRGGAISLLSFASLGALEVSDCEFTNNSAPDAGGALSVVAHNDIELVDVLFDRNTVTNSDSRGGAVSFDSVQDSELLNVRFLENSAVARGGALFAASSAMDFSSDFNGAGLSEAGCDMNGLAANEYCSEFKGNSAETGGAIYLQTSERSFSTGLVTIADVAFQNNQASVDGAALHVQRSSSDDLQPNITLTNTLFSGHAHPNYDAATPTLNNVSTIALFDDTLFTMNSSTLANNLGQPIHADGVQTEQTVRNSIIYANLDGPFMPVGPVLGQACNTSQPPASGGQSYGIDVNPLFTTTARGNFRLSSVSPARDVCADGPVKDLDGSGRPAGSAFDRGAFEFGAVVTAVGMQEQMIGDGVPAAVYLLALLLIGITGIVWFRPKPHHLPQNNQTEKGCDLGFWV